MIVVTGATGNVGRALVAILADAGQAVTAVARQAAASPGVAAVAADLTVAGTVTPALAGADSLFLLVPGAGAGVDAPALLAAAREAKISRVVLLSSQAVGTRPGGIGHAPMAAIEDAVAGSGLDWTILRSAGLASNAYAWAPAIKERQTVLAPYGDVALPDVDPVDVAGVAARVLTGPGHHGQTYVLTGPEATTPRQRTRLLAQAIGRPLNFVEVGHDEARAQMVTFMPAALADATLAILGHPTADETRVSPDVTTILGRPGAPFADWAQRNALAFS